MPALNAGSDVPLITHTGTDKRVLRIMHDRTGMSVLHSAKYRCWSFMIMIIQSTGTAVTV